MADTINLPGLGPQPKKVVYIGAGVAVIGAAVYYRYRQQQNAANIAASGANTGIDPATGYAYGSAEDAAALANQGNYINPTQPFAPGGGGGLVGNVPPGGIGTLPQGFTSNADWVQYVIQYMQQNNLVQDSSVLAAALGVYINGQPASTDQINLIQQATAIAGYPPISGANSYPPHINTGNPVPPVTNPPITQGPNPPTPTPTGPTKTVTHVIDGKSLNELLTFWGTTQSEFEQLNPGIQSTYRWYQAGKGYAPNNVKRVGDIIALNVGSSGRDVTVYDRR